MRINWDNKGSDWVLFPDNKSEISHDQGKEMLITFEYTRRALILYTITTRLLCAYKRI